MDLLLLFLQFELSTILNFLLGVLTGIILFFLFFLLFSTLNSKKRYRKRMLNQLPLEDHEVYELIEMKQNQLIETVRLTDNAYFKVAFDLSFELLEEIASHYFPQSRYPIYEITIEELIDLNRYITNRLEEMVNGKILRHFKSYRISSIVNMLHMKKAVDNSKVMKLSRKLKISKFYNASRTVLNYANPIYWFRRLAIKPTTEVLTKEVCKYIIAVVGEETNKIYSKSFSEVINDDDLEEKFDEIIEKES
ncbi:hypothetical protein HF295_05110 [Hujiaoplasma nucleasis]|uniref:Uncharacterized protein n=1 Tax=Hujiaoplasma nucleasis TaxID=2725268 RepID=A0A7L6N1Y7_9MOLU|nr:hypothetical protein [Hujiaoplasma nucleasis]QLY40270.1 hypothetical protein HF295_05110 [Hujiaoplasma nucleasis]